ncbi:hypothetical protein JBL43_15655 [Aureibaculum sp. A20]|uniref:Beta-lactamase-inhibitor-like PepSY-like domain-containing protein n=1 Tax=Aureibaculum flavum TaxID=2795986 RepID=A0ABS0WUS5_9FLAO|nr:hypothetical protein [Aureibaculum flavum]MBJ2175688.1 hypothetical protein [Aureibaculum flavum]
MKKIVLTLFLMGSVMQSYAQDVLFEKKMKMESIPVTIIESIDNDFGDFEMIESYAIPIEIIEEDVFVNRNIETDEDYETYQITLKGNKGEIVATYNKDGELLNTVEEFKNIKPSPEVRNAMGKAFPDWFIKKDYYKLTHFSGKEQKERYKFIIEKGKQKKVVYMDEKGEILNVHKKLELDLNN